jgi:hypothetical protein
MVRRSPTLTLRGLTLVTTGAFEAAFFFFFFDFFLATTPGTPLNELGASPGAGCSGA